MSVFGVDEMTLIKSKGGTYVRPKMIASASPEQLWKFHVDNVNAENNLVHALSSKKVRV
jgi:ribose 5-phosphate isomerase